MLPGPAYKGIPLVAGTAMRLAGEGANVPFAFNRKEDWAMTQNNLGGALQTLGDRESGTARFEEAVAAFRAALAVFEESDASHYVGIAKRNLARAEALLRTRKG
jgi:tetratricopeptide (TPR) repeat protein